MLKHIVQKTKLQKELTEKEIKILLSQKKKENVEMIFEAARQVREKNFGNKVFLYGFVYFSTFCRNDCTFCYYRKSNAKLKRYRKTLQEIVEISVELKDTGVHLIDLTTGEDRYYNDHPEKLVEIVQEVKRAADLPVMISPGVLSHRAIDMLAEAGVDWYALYQETHNKNLFQTLRIDQSYEGRYAAKEYAKSKGMLIEEGLLTGVGNQIEDTVSSFRAMKELAAAQVRTMTFVPQEGTPFENEKQPDFLSELLQIAVMRLLFPNVLIPASLDVDGRKGLEIRLKAGANVVTSIIPPKKGYAGVANSECDIDEGFRTVEGIRETLKVCGLETAEPIEYQNWIRMQDDKNFNFGSKAAGNRSYLFIPKGGIPYNCSR